VESAEEFRTLLSDVFEQLTNRVSFAKNWVAEFLDLQKLS
ncbi:IS630 family transposase, partial [Halobellus sp. Atlit-38R]